MANGHRFPTGFLQRQVALQRTTFDGARKVIVSNWRPIAKRMPGCYVRNESLYGGGKHCSLTMCGFSLGSSMQRDRIVAALVNYYTNAGWQPIEHSVLFAFRDPTQQNVIALGYPFPDRRTGLEISHRMYETAADADAAIAAGLTNTFIDDCEMTANCIASVL